MSNAYRIYAGPGSPYSHKVRAVFRYRRIPHTWLVPVGGFTGEGGLGSDTGNPDSPLTRAGKDVVPVVEYPGGQYKTDSTPVIDELEQLHEGRSIIHPDPAANFIARLIEDLADEYLPLPMFYSRWTTDKQWCGERQMIGWSEPLSDEELAKRAEAFLSRQGAQLGALDASQMQTAAEAFFAAMENLLKHQHFLLGSKPSIADFALYGQLTQYMADPTMCNLMKATAVRTFQWTHLVDDLSGWEGEWSPMSGITSDVVTPFLDMVRDFYLPMAQFSLVMSDGHELSDSANGLTYRAKTYLDLKHRLSALSDNAKEPLKEILEPSGCWQALHFKDGEAERAVPVLPQ